MAAALSSVSRPSRPSPRSPRAPSAIRRPRGRSPPSFRSGGAAAIPPGEPFSLSPPADKMAAPARTGGGSAHAPRASAWRWGSTWGWGGTDKTGGRGEREGRGGGAPSERSGNGGRTGGGGSRGRVGSGGAQEVEGPAEGALGVWGPGGPWGPALGRVGLGAVGVVGAGAGGCALRGWAGGDGRGALLGRAPRRVGGLCCALWGGEVVLRGVQGWGLWAEQEGTGTHGAPILPTGPPLSPWFPILSTAPVLPRSSPSAPQSPHPSLEQSRALCRICSSPHPPTRGVQSASSRGSSCASF